MTLAVLSARFWMSPRCPERCGNCHTDGATCSRNAKHVAFLDLDRARDLEHQRLTTDEDDDDEEDDHEDGDEGDDDPDFHSPATHRDRPNSKASNRTHPHPQGDGGLKPKPHARRGNGIP